ncbi:hypothetical protein [Arthrobacter sp. Alg241-R88]|uniref:hypothetical protein n=1 Tax=Arthrobacter sp. Alg241-R88 TaxID=2305984 RepID=UPI0013D686AD|nr:hypothetical protein [Arthrobacter sp. Alg241-R88]
MHDRTISITCLAAYGLWALAFLLIFAGTAAAVVGGPTDYLAIALGLMAHGLAISAAAATVSIRYMFKKQARFMRSAFELGRDASPGPHSVRQMR